MKLTIEVSSGVPVLTSLTDKQTFSPQYNWIYVATGEKDPHLYLFFPLAVQVPYYFHTLLLLCRVFHLMTTGGDARSDGMVMYHRGKAFQGVQSSLRDVENIALPLAVVALISIDVCTRPYNALTNQVSDVS